MHNLIHVVEMTTRLLTKRQIGRVDLRAFDLACIPELRKACFRTFGQDALPPMSIDLPGELADLLNRTWGITTWASISGIA